MKRVLPLLLLLTACTPPTVRPSWVDQPAAGHPDAVYLSAVGSGSTREDAEGAAFARLAQRIAVQVDASESARTSYTDRTGAPYEQTTELDRRVDLDADVLLMAAEVRDAWQDPRDGTHFSLAVMDRGVAGTAYRREMQVLLERATVERQAADESASRWQRFLRLGAALISARRHDELARVEAVVDPPGAPPVAPAIAGARDDLRRSIAVTVEPGPGARPSFVAVTRDAVLRAGLSPAPVDGDVRVRVRYDSEPRSFQQRRDHVVEWRATVEFIDPGSDQATEGLTLEGSGWGLDPAQAAAAAERDARHRLDAGLAAFLRGLLYPVEETDVASSGTPRTNP